jgi:hypothetical protein
LKAVGASGVDLGEIVGQSMGDGLRVVYIVPDMLVIRQLGDRDVEALEENSLRARRGGKKLVHPIVVAPAILNDKIGFGYSLGVVHVRLVFVRIDIRVREDTGHADLIAADLFGNVSVEVFGRHYLYLMCRGTARGREEGERDGEEDSRGT